MAGRDRYHHGDLRGALLDGAEALVVIARETITDEFIDDLVAAWSQCSQPRG